MHNKMLIYTLRTFPWLDVIREIPTDLIILGKLKQDIKKVEELLLDQTYDLILGIAKASKSSTFETQAVNKFNNGIIQRNGIDKYTLDFPKTGYKTISINTGFTTSFCNWAMYKIEEMNTERIRHSFIHINQQDLPTLEEYISSMMM